MGNAGTVLWNYIIMGIIIGIITLILMILFTGGAPGGDVSASINWS
jgi:hypothetical protein